MTLNMILLCGTIIHVVQDDHTEVVKQFLEIRPSLVSSTTKDGNTLAHLAAKKGSVDVLQVLSIMIHVSRVTFMFLAPSPGHVRHRLCPRDPGQEQVQ